MLYPRRKYCWAVAITSIFLALLPTQSRALDMNELGEAGLQAVAPSDRPVGLSGMLGDLSDSCSKVFTDLMKNADFASCINLIGLVPLATINPRDSILPSFLNYQKGLSVAPVCDQNILDTISAALKARCDAQDKQQATFVLLKSVSENYQDIRNLLLVGPKDSSDAGDDSGMSRYCLSTMLFRSEAASKKPFTRDHLQRLFSGSIDDLIKFLLRDTNVSCKYCGTAVFQLGFTLATANGYKEKDIQPIKKIIKDTCKNNAIDEPMRTDLLVINDSSARKVSGIGFYTLILAILMCLFDIATML